MQEEISSVMDDLDGVSVFKRTRDNHPGISSKAITIEKRWYLNVNFSKKYAKYLGHNTNRIPREILLKASKDQLSSLYQGMVEGDGTFHNGSWKNLFCGHNKDLADDFQELALKLGVRANSSYPKAVSQWIVRLGKRSFHTVRRPKTIQYKGMVWDITVRTGAFVARRNGKTFVTGNCPQELAKETRDVRTLVARIMARGRSLGFRCTLITQRPAKIDKNSISQVESMAVLRVTAPQDRKAIVDWFDDKGGENKHDILSGLGSLATGEGWVFTGVEQTYAHRKFRKIKTYDSSSTPVDKDGKAIKLDKGDLDLADFDNHLSYPGERTEEELEKVITKRRNLEADNLKLRTRLLKAESRYEAMRQAFVGIRTVIDNLLVDNDLEAVEYADLLLLRNEVTEDGKVRVDLNDISGTAGIFMDIPAPVLPEREYNPFPGFGEITEIQPMRPVVFEAPKRDPYDLPQRKMTAVDEQVIWAIRKRDGTDEENRDYVKLTTKNWLNSIERLLKEGTLYRDNEGRLRVGVNADIRDLSENQMETLLKIRDAKEEFHLYEYNHKTISVLTRKGFFKDGLTDKGKEAANFVAEYLSRKASLP